MNVLAKQLTLKEFQDYAKAYDFGRIKPSSLVIHHTWSPKKEEWQGVKGIAGLKNYYEGKGWSAGPHLFIAEDGIWLFTPMSEIGIHAGEGNAAWTRLGKTYTGFRGPTGSSLKSYSLGLEVVGDYDTSPWTGTTKENALGAIKCLVDVLGLHTEDIFFHRDFPSAKKSCPGWAITKEWLGVELSKLNKPASVPATENVSTWALAGWEWQRELGLDLSVRPQEKITAEWVFAILKKIEDIRANKT